MLDRIGSLLSGLALGACSLIGVRSGTEEPGYRVLDRVGQVEIRAYGPRIAAETTVAAGEIDARSEGFSRLASYIFGANHGQARIAMTAPVAQQAGPPEKIAMTAPVAQQGASGGEWRIRFFMPANYTLETLPAPDDARVRLATVPAETMAVYRFSGIPSVSAVADARETLTRALAGSVWRPEGEPVDWFYDPPWTIPPLRRNEVAVSVERAP